MAVGIDRGCIVGHRGAGNLAPGSTMAALRKAADLQLEWVEFDVRLTADKRLVIANTDDLSHLAGHPIKISSSTYQDLTFVNAAADFKEAHAPQSIPLFEDVLTFCKNNGLRTQIELKGEKGQDRELANAVIDVLQKPEFAFSENQKPLMTSFSLECLKTVHERAGADFETGLLIHTHLADGWRDLAIEASPDYVHFYGGIDDKGQRLTQRFGDAVRENGYKLNAYKVNTPEDARQALAAGAHRFTSDEPLRLLENS